MLGVLGVAALAAYGAMTLRDENGGTPAEAGNRAIRLSGVGAYDPDGDRSEHDSEAPNATDGDQSTYWTTETYRSFSRTKPGVGLVVDAGAVVEPSQITVDDGHTGLHGRDPRRRLADRALRPEGLGRARPSRTRPPSS